MTFKILTQDPGLEYGKKFYIEIYQAKGSIFLSRELFDTLKEAIEFFDNN